MFKRVFIAISLVFVIVSCETMPVKEDSKKETVKKEDVKEALNEEEKTITREEPSRMKVVVYGADKEVQAVELEGKTYYVIGGKDVENMSEQEIKSSSLVAPIKITEETVKGTKGIVVTYYDVKIFLGKKGSIGTRVGIFEPQNNAWTVGNDMDRSQSIQIQLSRGIAGPIDIKRGSISLTYH